MREKKDGMAERRERRSRRRSRGRQPAEMRQHFKIFAVRRKFGSAPCGEAVIVKGAFLTDRAAQPNWEYKHNHTLYKLMGAANVTNENT